VREQPLPQGTDDIGRPRARRGNAAGSRGGAASRDATVRRSSEVDHALRSAESLPSSAGRRRPDKPRVASLPPRLTEDTATTPLVRTVRKSALAEIVRMPLPTRPRHIEDLTVALTRLLGQRLGDKGRSDLDAAARAYEHDRFTESLRLAARLTAQAPDVPEIRELHGLSLYRLGRWPKAIVELEAFRALAGTAEQNAVLADCYRALRRWTDVDELWEELRESSPNPAVVNEGRIVAAGALADRGDLPAALRLIEKGWRVPARPQVHHVRRAYAMADLYERSGSPVRARELFSWVRGIDAEFADVGDRIRHLG